VLLVACALCFVVSAHAQTNFTSTIDEATGRPWLGFGYNQNPLDADATGNADVTPWSADHWRMMTERIAAIKPGLVRAMLGQEYFNPAHVSGTYTWDSPQMQTVYQLFDWYKANHIPILTGPWSLLLANYGNVGPNDADNAQWLTGFQSAEYSQICADLMYQLRVVKGYDNIIYFTPQNEPKGIANMSWDIYDACLDNLTGCFTTLGLPVTVITGPDAWDPMTWMAAKYSSQKIYTYENHAYASGTAVVSGSLESTLRTSYGASIYQYDNTKACLLGEVGADGMDVDAWYTMSPVPTDAPNTYTYGLNCFDYGLQAIRGGQSAALIWTLCNFYWKESGMWSWNTTNPDFGGTTLRPFFYTWSMLSKYFPHGMTMYRMTQPAGNSTRIAAGQQLNSDGSSHWTIGMVNQSDTAENITVMIPGWAGGTFDQFTFSQASPGDGTSLALPSTTATTSSLQNNGIIVAVPARGCVLLTTLNLAAVQPVSGFVDTLDNWKLIESKSANIIASSVGGATTASLSDSADGAIIYRHSNPSGIDVNVIGADGKADGRIRLFTSPDNVVWTQLATTNSAPVYSGGGYWAASTCSNNSIVPFGTNYLKVELVNDGTGWKTQVDQVAIHPGQYTLFDPLNDLARCDSSTNIGLDNSQPWLAAGDLSRAYNNSTSGATLVYKVSNYSDFKVRVYGLNGGGALNFYASPDEASWSAIATTASQQHITLQSWFTFDDVPACAIPAGMNYLKIECPAGAPGTTQIGEVTLSTSREPCVLRDPMWDAEKMLSSTNLIYAVNFSVLGYENHLSLANDTDNGVMIYRYPSVGSFDIRVFGADLDVNNKVLAYGSPDNVTWTQIPTVNSAPQETDGYYWADSHYTPSATIPANTNFLKLVLVNCGAGWKTIANSVTIYPLTPNITSAASAIAMNGGAFSYQISASSTPTRYGATGLPPGLTIDTSTGLISGTPTLAGTYTATITATNANGTGSASLTITVFPFTAPPVPTGLTGLPGSGQTTLTWNASAAATSYHIKRSLTKSGDYVTIASGVTETTYTDASASNGTTYYYVVSAVNSAGESLNSAQASAMPTAPTALPTPWSKVDVGSVGTTGTSYYAGGSTFVGQGAGSDINARSDSFQFVYASTTATTFSVVARALTPPTGSSKVGVMIRQNANTTGTAVKMAAVIIEPNGTAYQARFAYRSGTNGSITWSSATTGLTLPLWLKITRSGTTYRGYVSSDGVNWGNALGSFTGTINSSTSFFGMAVCSRDTTSLAMETFDNVSAPGWTPPPGAPDGLTATAASQTQVNLSWNPVSGATGYQVWRGNSWSGSYTQIGTSLVTSYLDTGLSPATTYYYMARATGSNGSSGNSTVTSATTPPNAPSITSGLSAGGMVGTAFSYRITGSNIPTGFGATNLPGGLGVDTATGWISGNPAATGSFDVPIRAINAGGTGTATLVITLLPPPVSETERGRSTQLHISGTSATVWFTPSVGGHTYQLQSSDSLTSGLWANVGTAQPGTGADLIFAAPMDAAEPHRFYRFLIGP
jgi:hypothetical protein